MKRLLGVAVALVLTLAVPAAQAWANGVPQKVKLTYIKGLSNYGPEDAVGMLEFSFAEAYAKAEVEKLPAPGVSQSYQGWLMKAGTKEALNIGVFTIDPVGRAVLDVTLPVVDDYSYDLFLVTVEDSTQPVAKQSERRSVGGYFTAVAPIVSATPAPDTEPGSEASETSDPKPGKETAEPRKPDRLPDTGAVALDATMVRSLLLLLAISSSAIMALKAMRRSKGGNR